jgi:hypothetical protein
LPVAYRGDEAIFHDLTAGVTNLGRSIVKSMANIGICKECLVKFAAPRGWNSAKAVSKDLSLDNQTHYDITVQPIVTSAIAITDRRNML